MPLLWLLPLLLVLLIVLWMLLLPIALCQRYRSGKARRPAVAWAVRLNAWLVLVSTVIFLASAWLAGHWIDAALEYAAAGLATGMLAGIAGLALTRFEAEAQGLFYTPNRWLILALTAIVAGRIVLGMIRVLQSWSAGGHAAWLSQQGSLLAVGGLLAGYYLAYTWGLHFRLRAA